jgi:hypothetical protein
MQQKKKTVIFFINVSFSIFFIWMSTKDEWC